MAIIRARRDEDIAACVAVLAEVHAADRYPILWPADAAGWLRPAGLLAAWVAEHEGRPVGHVALCGATDEDAALLRDVDPRLSAEKVALVARLFVAPRARGQGLSAALLQVAWAEARDRGLRAALDVVGSDRAAVALYERAGWQRVTSIPVPWAGDGGERAVLHTYLAPD